MHDAVGWSKALAVTRFGTPSARTQLKRVTTMLVRHMKRGHIIKVVFLLGAVTSIVTLIVSIFSLSNLDNFFSFFSASVELPIWVIVAFFAILSVSLIAAGWKLRGRVRADVIPADAQSVVNYVTRNGLLDEATNLDCSLYTAETLVIPWRQILQNHAAPIKIRLLIRRPEVDKRKHSLSEGSLDAVRQISDVNDNLDLDVRFYDGAPLLRLLYFVSSSSVTLLSGVYLYDKDQPMRYIGAEKNTLLVLKDRRPGEQTLIRAIHSRFEHLWENCSSLRAVIFDMDGVLIDSMDTHVRAWRSALDSEGIAVEDEVFRREIYKLEGFGALNTAQALFDRFAEISSSPELLRQIVRRKQAFYIKASVQFTAFEGASQILAYLKLKSVPVAVVTGSARTEAEKTLRRLYGEQFRVIVCGDDVTPGKPDPLPYETALRDLDIGNPDQCLVVENAPLGIQSAVSAGIPTFGLLINSPIGPQELEGKGALKVFASHQELLRDIQKIKFGELAVRPNNRIQSTE